MGGKGKLKQQKKHQERLSEKCDFKQEMKNNVDERVKLGNENMKNGDYFSAVLRYSEAFGTSKKSLKILLKRCQCLMKMKDYENAAKDALECIEVDPTFRVPYFHAMDCFLMVGKTSKVEELVTKFRVTAPLIICIDENQVFKMNKLKDLKEDIVDFSAANDFVKCLYRINEALEIASADGSLHFMKLNMLISLQRLEEADEANLTLCSLLNQQINFKKALMTYVDGDFNTASLLFSSISNKLGKKMKAFEDIHGKLNRILTVIQEADELAQTDVKSAVEVLQSVLNIESSNPKLKKLLHIKIANFYFNFEENYSEVIRHASKAFKLDPNCVEAILIRAKSHLLLKMFLPALADCEKILMMEISLAVKTSVENLKIQIALSKIQQTHEKQKAENSDDKNNNETSSSFQENSSPEPNATASSNDHIDSRPDTTYSSTSHERVDNRSPKSQKPSQPSASTQYSFSSADNANFKEYVEKPKSKPQKSYKEQQNEIKADQSNQKGNKEYAAKRYSNAIKFYSEAILLCPKTAKFFSNRAACHILMGNYQLGVSDAIRCTDIDASAWRGYLRAINCYLMLGDIRQAEDFINKLENNVIGVDSVKYNEISKLKNLKVLNESIEKLFNERSYQDCLKNLESVMEIAKSCVKYQDMQIECLIMTKKFNEATSILADRLLKNSRDSNCIFLKGFNLYHKGDLEAGLEHFESSLKLDPDHQRAKTLQSMTKKLIDLFHSGVSKYKMGSHYEAQELYTAALSIDKTNKPITLALLYNRSSANFKLERYKDVLEDCTEFLKLDETHVKALTRRAHSHFKLKEFEECIIDCEEIQRLKQSEEIKKLIEDAKFAILIQKGKSNYLILGVATTANKGEIKKAFHKLSLLYHPDKHSDATAIDKKKLEIKFQEIIRAYNSLMACQD